MKFDKLRTAFLLVLLIFMMSSFANAACQTRNSGTCKDQCTNQRYTIAKCCDGAEGTCPTGHVHESTDDCPTDKPNCCCTALSGTTTATGGGTTTTTPGGGGGGTISASELSGPIITVACLLYDVVIGIAGAIGSLIIAFSGLKWVMSADDPGARKQAKDTIIHTVVGLVIILAAAKIVEAIASSTTSFKGCP